MNRIKGKGSSASSMSSVRQCVQLASALLASVMLLSVSNAHAKEFSYKLLMTSIPKTGTFMLGKLVDGLTGLAGQGSSSTLTAENLDLKPDQYLMSHAPALEANLRLLKDRNFKVIVLLRDPRDVVVSMYHYFGPKHAERLKMKHDVQKDELTMLHITKWYNATNPKIPHGPYMKGDFKQFMDWKKFPNVYFTSYEALVGSKGGGSDERQRQEIRALANFLEVPLDEEKLSFLAESLYGGTATFRNGSIGTWKTHFNKYHVAAFKEVAGDLLIELGYEKDLNWGSEIG